MANAWIEHIRKYAKDNNMTYSCALTDPNCKATYKKAPKPLTQKKERELMGAEEATGPANKRSAHKEKVVALKSKMLKSRAIKGVVDKSKEIKETALMGAEDKRPADNITLAVVEKKKRGRPSKYATAEEARKAKIANTIASAKKRKEKAKAVGGGRIKGGIIIPELDPDFEPELDINELPWTDIMNNNFNNNVLQPLNQLRTNLRNHIQAGTLTQEIINNSNARTQTIYNENEFLIEHLNNPLRDNYEQLINSIDNMLAPPPQPRNGEDPIVNVVFHNKPTNGGKLSGTGRSARVKDIRNLKANPVPDAGSSYSNSYWGYGNGSSSIDTNETSSTFDSTLTKEAEKKKAKGKAKGKGLSGTGKTARVKDIRNLKANPTSNDGILEDLQKREMKGKRTKKETDAELRDREGYMRVIPEMALREENARYKQELAEKAREERNAIVGNSPRPTIKGGRKTTLGKGVKKGTMKGGASIRQKGLSAELRSWIKSLATTGHIGKKTATSRNLYKSLCDIVHSGDFPPQEGNYHVDLTNQYDPAVQPYIDEAKAILKHFQIDVGSSGEGLTIPSSLTHIYPLHHHILLNMLK